MDQIGSLMFCRCLFQLLTVLSLQDFNNYSYFKMSRYFSVVAVSSASFLLGLHYSDTIKDNYKHLGFMREGHAESVLVPSRPPMTDLNHKSVAQSFEVWKQPSRASQIMEFGFPGYDNLRTYSDFVVSYDRRNRNAHWVQEHLTPESMKYSEEINRSA